MGDGVCDDAFDLCRRTLDACEKDRHQKGENYIRLLHTYHNGAAKLVKTMQTGSKFGLFGKCVLKIWKNVQY